MTKFISDSPEQTIEIGRRIGNRLKGGEVIALVGSLGSGKTHLVKGIALGVEAADFTAVNSPTFVIINEYAGRLYVYHIDAYRIEKEADFEMLGFDDYCQPDSVVVIEWADKVRASLKGVGCIEIELTHQSPVSRAITIKNVPDYLK